MAGLEQATKELADIMRVTGGLLSKHIDLLISEKIPSYPRHFL